MGRLGESIAARYLESRGMSLVDRNVAIGRGEIDLLMMDGNRRAVVEVRTKFGGGDPIDAIDRRKRDRVRRLASSLIAHRVDFVGVGLTEDGVTIHWVPG